MRIFFNGPIITMNDDCKFVETLIEDNGKIVFTGSEHLANLFLKSSQKNADWFDLKGFTLMPGFIDAHSHLSDTAQTLKTADLRSARNFDDIICILKDFINNHPEHKNLIIGLSYDHTILSEQAHPTKEQLDQVSKDIPIAVIHTNLHMCCVNTPLLKILEIDENTPQPSDGVIGRMPYSNEPSGYLEEAPSFPIRNLLKKYYSITESDLLDAQNLYIKNGILTIQDGAVGESLIKIYTSLAKNNSLITDVVAFPCFNFGEGVGNSIALYSEYVNHYINKFKIGGYKLLLDGSPQGKTAWLSAPYEGEKDYCGYPWLTDSEVENYVEQSFTDNLQLLTHCNGDAASEQLINIYEKIIQKRFPNHLPSYSSRPVMIHCQTLRKDQISRMKRLNMIASIFVDHVYYWGDIHKKNLGPTRASHISPLKSVSEADLTYTIHNDSPVILPNVFHSIWCACNRLTRSGDLLGEEECIDVYSALKAVTINAAYSYFEEDEKGTLEAGKRADFIILDANPLAVNKMHLKNINVIQCFKDGQVIFKK